MSKPRPAPLRERDITRQIAREYYKEFDQLIESDVIIVGAGPSGLICAHDLAAMGFRTLLVEQSLALGGGFWSGGTRERYSWPPFRFSKLARAASISPGSLKRS